MKTVCNTKNIAPLGIKDGYSHVRFVTLPLNKTIAYIENKHELLVNHACPIHEREVIQ